MKEIDFSCKHDVLIRYPDGSLRPMDEHIRLLFLNRRLAPAAEAVFGMGLPAVVDSVPIYRGRTFIYDRFKS